MYDVPYNFYWEDLVPVPSEFIDLRSLYLDFEGNEYDDETTDTSSYDDDRSPPLQLLQLSFPQLSDLFIQERWGSDNLKFNPVHTPSNLNKVSLELSSEELNEFCDLPIEYICHIYLKLEAYSRRFTDAFYSSTNRLLGKMGNSGGTTSVKLYNAFGDADLELDTEKIEWYNVTTLEIGCLAPSMLMSLLAKLPRVTSVEIKKFSYGSYESDNFQHNSQVEKIRITEFGCEWPVDTETEFIVDILKQHNRIKSLLLPKNMVERAKEMIHNSASIYPHWQQISVTVAAGRY